MTALRQQPDDDTKPPRRRRTVLAITAAAVAVTAVTAAVAVTRPAASANATEHTSVSGARPAPPTAMSAPGSAVPAADRVPRPRVGGPAGDYLRHLAASVADAPTDASAGGYAYVHIRQWAAEGDLENNKITMIEFDEQRWRAFNASGVEITQRAGRPAETATYRAGQLFPPAGRRIPDTAGQLAALIGTFQPWQHLGAAAGIRGWSALTSYFYFDRAQRSAALLMLANSPGVRFHGTVRDRAGRPGVAVGYDQDGARDLLIINPHTGVLLAYAHTAPRAGSPPLATETYVLFLDQHRTMAVGD